MSLKPAWCHALGVSVAAWAACVIAVGAMPQASGTAVQSAPPTSRLASSGVYTAAQAARGRQLYGDICQGCHNTASQTGAPFAKRWRGAMVSDFFRLMTDEMPKDTPGSLTPQERVDVIAYMLKLNDFAVGTDELPIDVEQLKKIVIDLPGGHSQ
ncbi:MAG: c-type cytochrome [Acidobacteria bacterium]|nr:c-type cytochrome [Acidobacteriota bacterium]